MRSGSTLGSVSSDRNPANALPSPSPPELRQDTIQSAVKREPGGLFLQSAPEPEERVLEQPHPNGALEKRHFAAEPLCTQRAARLLS